MRITNSITGKKEEFIPIEEGKVKMYACGITVYDLSHIGHARQAIVYSMFESYLRHKGYEVKYVRNYTDVDDKIIKKANELHKDALDFSREQILETEKDMEALHVLNADITTKASEYIEKIIEVIKQLIEKDYAYSTKEGDVYFSVEKFKKYGKLSHRKVDQLLNGVRIELQEEKINPVDFALWKSAKEGEIYWKSPWGNGRPGWHIECSTMVLDTLGETIDIHGGGRDLLFPHHENEIAQSESLTGKEFVKYWTHCGLIKINGEKMSKSLGNSLTIRDAIKEYNYEVIKYVMHSKHYTSDINITKDDFSIAERHLYYFYNTIKNVEEFIKNYKDELVAEELKDDIIDNIYIDFEKAMDDDFNTPVVIANLHGLFRHINNLIIKSSKNNKKQLANTLEKALKEIKEVYNILDFLQQDAKTFENEMKNKYLSNLNINKSEIEEKIKERMDAKLNKDYELADKIRKELDEQGISLNDTNSGTVWDIKSLHI